MPLLPQPFNVQVNWTNTDSWPMWEQTDANYLNQNLKRIEIDRQSFRGSLRSSTCRITVYDPDRLVRPGLASSRLYPNVQLGRRVRVLMDDAGTPRPWFFGYVKEYRPNTLDLNPPEVTVTVEGPLATLAPRAVSMPALVWPRVYKPGDFDSALLKLLLIANLANTNLVSLDNVGRMQIPGLWGNATRPFGAWLGELCNLSSCLMADEPRYATSASDVDFVLHWYRPSNTTAVSWTWDAGARQLEATPDLALNGETP